MFVAAEPEDPQYGDTAHCKTALHKPVVSPLKEAAETGDAHLYRQLVTDLL